MQPASPTADDPTIDLTRLHGSCGHPWPPRVRLVVRRGPVCAYMPLSDQCSRPCCCYAERWMAPFDWAELQDIYICRISKLAVQND